MSFRVCYVCQGPATCFGQQEGQGPIQFGCDTHCGHGNEDACCRSIEDLVDLRAGTRPEVGQVWRFLNGVSSGRAIFVERLIVEVCRWTLADGEQYDMHIRWSDGKVLHLTRHVQTDEDVEEVPIPDAWPPKSAERVK